MIPSPPREDEVRQPALLARWLASVRAYVVQSLTERPRSLVWTTPPVTGTSGVTYVSADAVPWPVGAVVLATVQAVDAATASPSAAPYALTQQLAGGQWRVDWRIPGATGRYRLVLVLTEAVNG